MSGWIKFEKGLESDPRVTRIARALHERQGHPIESGNAVPLQLVTLVCGALARLWTFADSYVRDDDTLDMSLDELDAHLGIPGFCKLLPPDWLVAVDARTVELPGFQAHNGAHARRQALTQKRVASHRKRTSVSTRNAAALPDQTRPDQKERLDQTRPTERDRDARLSAPDTGKRSHGDNAPNGTRLPAGFTLTPARREIAEGEALNADRTFASFCDHWRSAAGARGRKSDWEATWRNWCRREHDQGKGNGINGNGRQLTLQSADELEVAEIERGFDAGKTDEQIAGELELVPIERIRTLRALRTELPRAQH